MDSSSSSKKVIVVVIVLIIVGFVGYKVFTATPPANVEIAAEGQDILALSDKLNNVTIDQDFFSSVLFQNLRNFQTVLTPEPQGRNNPFATIGNESGASAINPARFAPGIKMPTTATTSLRLR